MVPELLAQNMVHSAQAFSPSPILSIRFPLFLVGLKVYMDPTLVLRMSSPASTWSRSVTTDDLSRRMEWVNICSRSFASMASRSTSRSSGLNGL